MAWRNGSRLRPLLRFPGPGAKHDFWPIHYTEVHNIVDSKAATAALESAMSDTPPPPYLPDDEVALEPARRKFTKELSAGLVSLVLLTLLSQAEEPLYGYQIAKRFEGAGEAVLNGKQSALYPVLRNLSEAGLLESFVEPSTSGPPRRYYRITPLGRAVQLQWAQTWAATRDFTDSILAGTNA